MRLMKFFAVCLTLALAFAAGCSSARNNIVYDSGWGDVKKLDKPVTGALLPIVDMREDMKSYPKEVIIQTDYSGNTTYDINNRTVEDVVGDALAAELERMGVKLVKAEGMEGPLDKESAEKVKNKVAGAYPDAQVAFGAILSDFVAKSRRTLIAHKVHVTAGMKLYVLDIKSGDLIWADYKTEWDDTVASADHNYMIEQLNKALVGLMEKGVRENMSMREMLARISGRQ